MRDEAIPAKPRSSQLALVLQESEKLLYELQMAEKPDNLWRWYFRLTGGAG